MRPELNHRLAALPRLNRSNAAAAALRCKICGQTALFFDVVDFNKCAAFYYFGPSGVPVSYHRCDQCGFLFTAFFDDWCEDDFRRFIYNDDYRLVDPEYEGIRPRLVANHLAQFLISEKGARILDYGAGSGHFAVRMAELGFRYVASYDPFAMPAPPEGKFDIITCTEVIEHVPFPLASLEAMRSLLNEDGCIILGETLQPPDIGTLRGNWWYVAPRNGHISTFADRTLAAIAERLGMIFHRGNGHHVLRAAGRGPLAKIAERFGPAMACYRLSAPPEGAAAVGFHGMEGTPGEQFRWSAHEVLTWQISIPPGPQRLIQLRIPYLHESRQGFATSCRINAADRPASVSICQSAIVAELPDVSPGPLTVELRTPQLQRPPRDNRMIGLAIAAESGPSAGNLAKDSESKC